MTCWAASGSGNAQGPLIMSGGTGSAPAFGVHIVPWVATARDLDNSSGPGNVAQSAQRTSTYTFMRGLRETIRLSTSTSSAWEWRRICFTLKGTAILQAASGSLVPFWIESSSGWSRLAFDITNSANTADQASAAANLVFHLFEGTYATDYFDILTAKPDPRRVKVMYDKTINILSTNNNGTSRVFKRYHPMNKSLVYDDQEIGNTETQSIISTEGRPGMGDYYVVDFFKAHPSSTTSDQIQFEPQATLFWHER